MTLIELVIAIVIVSVGLMGVLSVFVVTVKSSVDPMINKQLLAIADEMMEEITLKSYAPIANAAAGGCARNTFNDIGDYNGYATTNMICDVDGNQIPALAGYSVSVVVVPDTATFAAVGVSAASRITVTASFGAWSVNLVGWRTNYAS